MTLVTGATGHIGNTLIRKLIEKGEDVRALISNDKIPDFLKNIGIKEFKVADITNYDQVNDAVNGCNKVYHLAAIISISSDDITDELYNVNVNGPANIVNACIENNVSCLVHVSSVHALPDPKNNIEINEKLFRADNELFGAYAKTKLMGTLKVLDGVEKGLDAVICMPTGVIGPNDYRGSEFGKVFRDILDNKLPIMVEGRYNFVDVRDVADGLIDAMDKGVKGEMYLLGGEIMSISELINAIQKIVPEVKKPQITIPSKVMIPIAYVTEKVSKIFKFKPQLTVYGIKTMQSNCNISSQKAINEIGYSYRSPLDSIKDMIEFYNNIKK